MLSFLTEPMFSLLMFLSRVVPGHDLGIVIILLTIIIKVVLFHLSRQSIRAQSRMALHKDQIEEIKKKYKTKEEQSRETMKCYKENKINPFSGCLPLIIQLVILIALYQAFGFFFHEEQVISVTRKAGDCSKHVLSVSVLFIPESPKNGKEKKGKDVYE